MEDKAFNESIKTTIEDLIYNLVSERPKNVTDYMVNWLQKSGSYTSNGLTLEEKEELGNLRSQIKKYRELDAHNNHEEDDNHSEESDEEPAAEIDFNKARGRLSMPRIAVSAEVYGEFNEKKSFVPIVIKKTEEQKQQIKSRLLHSFLFNNLDKKDLEVVIDAMEEKTYEEKDEVILQGDLGDCLYVVDSGELNTYKRFNKGDESLGTLVKVYETGDAFGELALLYNTPRAASVIAKTKCVLWKLDRETFNHIVKESAQKKRNNFIDFLNSVEILSTIDEYEKLQISDALKVAFFNIDDYVIREGEMGDVFYVVEEGEAIATKTLEPGKPAVEVKKYFKGDYFGELALIKGDPRAANVLAVTNLKLITLDRQSFKRLLGPIEPILQRNSESYQKYFKK